MSDHYDGMMGSPQKVPATIVYANAAGQSTPPPPPMAGLEGGAAAVMSPLRGTREVVSCVNHTNILLWAFVAGLLGLCVCDSGLLGLCVCDSVTVSCVCGSCCFIALGTNPRCQQPVITASARLLLRVVQTRAGGPGCNNSLAFSFRVAPFCFRRFDPAGLPAKSLRPALGEVQAKSPRPRSARTGHPSRVRKASGS